MIEKHIKLFKLLEDKHKKKEIRNKREIILLNAEMCLQRVEFSYRLIDNKIGKID